MSKKVYNGLSAALLVAYIALSFAGWFDQLTKKVLLTVVGSVIVVLSMIYALTNPTLERTAKVRELLTQIFLLGAIAVIWLLW